jgi:hypothetical protein
MLINKDFFSINLLNSEEKAVCVIMQKLIIQIFKSSNLKTFTPKHFGKKKKQNKNTKKLNTIINLVDYSSNIP